MPLRLAWASKIVGRERSAEMKRDENENSFYILSMFKDEVLDEIEGG